jgi:hypothetical protein
MTDHHHHDREVVVTDSGGGAGLVIGFIIAAILAVTLLWAFAFDNDGDAPTQVDVTVQQEGGG